MINFYIKTQDNKVLYTEYYGNSSSDRTFLYIHGGPGNGCFDFSYMANLLNKNFNIISFDQRGCMKSSAILKSEYFVSEMLVDDIETVRKFFNLDKISLIAHSYGGEIALRYYLKYSEHVSDIVFICPSFDLKDTMKNVYKQALYEFLSIGDMNFSSFLQNIIDHDNINSFLNNFSEIPSYIRNKIYGDENLPKEIEEFIFSDDMKKEDFLKAETHREKLFSETIIGKDFTPYLKNINVPSLLILGDNDPVCTKRQEIIFSDSVQKGKVMILSNCGHFPYLYNTKELFNLFVDFYKKL